MNDAELHYLGGVVDSDGSIYIQANKRSGSRFGFSMVPVLQVGMTARPEYAEPIDMFEELAEEAGIKVQCEEDKHGMRLARAVGPRQAPAMAEELLPYLRAKEEQARLIAEAPWTTQGVPMPEEDYRAIVDRREQIRQLNSDTKTKYDAERLTRELGREA